ncbi:MAG TPA: M20/M25/M40 family metallo-hydrolase [Candidatus Polarisedimenticolia bacterium]|nr:M20/M25/M40 family metallo-hydrolase [Candidatus Polarisedimenticolia bacterium]
MAPPLHRLAKKTAAAVLAAAVLATPAAPQAQDQGAAPSRLPQDVESAMKTINSGRIKAHLRFLSDDKLEGRGTGQKGGDIAADYIATYMQLSALWPGAAGNSYLQRVPLVGAETLPGTTLAFVDAQGKTLATPRLKEECVIWSDTQQPEVDSSGPVVFVGYGAVAPEFQWDDYKGKDVAGAVLLMLVNDPPSDDPAFFGGKGLTYYGRWTYKFEMAARKGAAGALLIHSDASAGYGWGVVRSSWGRERSSNELDPRAPAPLRQAGWLTEAAARTLLQAAGQDLDALRAAAAKPDFTPVALPVTSRAHVVTRIRKFDSANVLAYVPGTDDKLKDQAVVVTAHYDHLGIGDPDETGDTIYNGAYDNASGVATMLEMARAFRLAPVKPRRSVLFAAVTAEEQGLRGSEYYAAHPTFHPGKIAANFNLDGASVLGITEDMTFLGGERSSLKALIEDAAREFSFRVSPDARPEQGSFYRSDHFNFAKIGVPAVSVKHGQSFQGKDPAWGEAQWKEYNEKRYHRPSDEYDPGWDLEGAEKTAQVLFYLAYRAATMEALPAWNPGDEFASAREAALKAAGSAGGR